MMRAAGAISRMTALQMATESLAVPKSERKTMVERAAGSALRVLSNGVFLEQAVMLRAIRSTAAQSRLRRQTCTFANRNEYANLPHALEAATLTRAFRKAANIPWSIAQGDGAGKQEGKT